MKQFRMRRGGALVMALLTLMIVMLLSGAVLRSLLAARQQATRNAAALQAAWLAESALDRAAVRLAHDANYTGETWQLDIAADGDESIPATAKIEIKADNDVEKQIHVSVEFRGTTASRRSDL